MGRVILCMGQTSKTPYHFTEPDVNVFSIEELCYVLSQNAFLLEEDLVCRELIDWIERECRLPELSKLLYPFLNGRGSAGTFVMTILEYVRLYESEELLKIEKVMKLGENLSVYEKRKKRIDFLVENEKYAIALAEYDKMLGEIPQGEKSLSAAIWNNRGVVQASMFAFAQAAESFRKSYELEPDDETWIRFLAAKRMELSDADYISFVSEEKEKYPLSLALEQRMEEALTAYEEDEKKIYLEQLRQWRDNENAVQYYAKCESVVEKLKEQYRSHAVE